MPSALTIEDMFPDRPLQFLSLLRPGDVLPLPHIPSAYRGLTASRLTETVFRNYVIFRACVLGSLYIVLERFDLRKMAADIYSVKFNARQLITHEYATDSFRWSIVYAMEHGVFQEADAITAMFLECEKTTLGWNAC